MAISKLASNLSRLTDIKVSDYDIWASTVAGMNDPRNLPSYKAGDDFAPYGRDLINDSDLFNGYLSSLVRKYGVIFQRIALADNPLKTFRKGIMPVGGLMESILYDTSTPEKYKPFYRDEKGRTLSPFEQNLIEPVSKTYQDEQNITDWTTIIDTVDTQFFQNLNQFHTYVWGKISSIVNGAYLDEFYHTKLAISKPIADNIMPLITIKNGQDVSKKLAKAIKSTAKKFRYFSRSYNGEGINQATLVSNIVVMVNVDRSVDLDMDYFGQLFNPENSRDFQVQYLEVDSFPSIWRYTKNHVVTAEDAQRGFVQVRKGENGKGEHMIGDILRKGTLAVPGATDAEQVFDGSKLAAVVMDRDAIQLWDKLPLRLSTVNNPRSRYANVYLQKDTLIAYVQGLNAVGIYIGDDDSDKPPFKSIEEDLPAVSPVERNAQLFAGVPTEITVGATQDIQMSNFPVSAQARAMGLTKIALVSSDPTVATVSAGDVGKGTYTVTAKKAGTTTIAVQDLAGKPIDSQSMTLTVK